MTDDQTNSQPPEIPPPDQAHPEPLDQKAVLATVVEILHQCAAVVMPDGTKASLAWKEIWPTFRIHDKPEDFKVVEELHDGTPVVRAVTGGAGAQGKPIADGDKLFVVPCGHAFGHGYRTSVSHLRVFNNPWDAVATWKDKEVKSFIVESVTKTHALGVIAPGVRARIPLEGLDSLLPEGSWHGHQIPLQGDELAGWFLHENVDADEQVVTLNFLDYIQSTVAISDVLGATVTPTQLLVSDGEDDRISTLTRLASRLRINTVLLLDDDADFLKSLGQYLENLGITVLSCNTDTSAKTMIDQQGMELDLAVIDVNLRRDQQTKDHYGIKVARYLRELFPDCPMVLTTGEDIDPQHAFYAAQPVLVVQDIVYKPFGEDSLYRALSAVGKPARAVSELCARSNGTPQSHTVIREHKIKDTLADLQESLGAEAAVLFEICPVTDEVSILSLAGPQKKFHDDKEKLAWSPIRDAAISEEEIFTEKAIDEYPKHRYLLKAYNYQSCAGVPVSPGGATYHAYALFTFHPDPSRFTRTEALRQLRRAAREIGLFMRNRKLEEQRQQMKPFELMGQAYGSMAHDLSKDLSTVFMLSEIEYKLANGEDDDARDLLRRFTARLRHAQQIVRSFRDMARGQHEEISVFSARQTLLEILPLLQDELSEYQTTLTSALEIGDHVQLHMRRSNLEQLLTNIVLNAGQQIKRLPPSYTRTGEVCVAAAVEQDEIGVRWLVLRIHDNGPGIHRRDFERVFDLHYTTKDQGCGMGLDICRKIAAGVTFGKYTGSVWVQRSLLLAGTTFEVRLPIYHNGSQ